MWAVFRIGDDEFIAILRRRDYENRAQLLERLEQVNTKNTAARDVTIVWGMADFRPEEDKRLASVFERASRQMGPRE